MLSLIVQPSYWSTVLNFLVHQYFAESHTTCILLHSKFEFQLELPWPVLIIEPQTIGAEVFQSDIYDYDITRYDFEQRYVRYNDWILKLTVAIEQSNCETFLVFQENIPQFARNFYNASIYSIWRSIRNRFIFAYTKELLNGMDANIYFDNYLFHDQPNILLVEAQFMNASLFYLKTNRFEGARNLENSRAPITFDTLQKFDAIQKKLLYVDSLNAWQIAIHANKLKNLKGREIIIALFDYKPFMLVDYEKQPQLYNRDPQKSQDGIFIDGTEVRMMLVFCELHNCTIQADTSSDDWGDIYVNATGHGLAGMVMSRQNDYAIGGMYVWYEAYQSMDLTQFLGRSGVTCMVPVPERLINWALPLRPFQATLWLGFSVLLLLECCALCFTHRYETTKKISRTWYESFCFSIVSTLKLLVNQSTNYVTTAYSLRVVLLSSYLIDIIMTTVYGGGLAAILTLPTLEEAADSRLRLYKHKLTWSGTSQAWTTTIDHPTEDPVLTGLIKQFRVYDANQIEEYSRTEQMAFVVERMQFGHIANSEMIGEKALKRLKLMVDDIYESYTVAFVPRLWPFLSVYNDFVLAWHSSGLDMFWEWKISADYMDNNRQNRIVASKKQNVDIGPVKLGLDNFIGIITIWCFGMVSSLLVFFTEVWHAKAQLQVCKSST